MFDDLSAEFLKERTGSDAINDLSRAGVRYGVLLSEAYMFASPVLGFHLDAARVAELTRQENEFNVAAARDSHGRLVAFVGIDPLSSIADRELSYWSHRGGAAGIKLHLANSAFDPQSPKDVKKLQKFFAEARAAHMPLIIHVRNTRNYTADDAQIFINQVLPFAGDLPIQIAHCGGWGGLDGETLTALSEYAEAIRRHAPGTKNLFFDLALVVMHEKTDPLLLRRLVALMEEIGLNRFVMGSDWPAKYTTEQYNALLESELPLTRAQWTEILRNRAPWIGGVVPRDSTVGSR